MKYILAITFALLAGCASKQPVKPVEVAPVAPLPPPIVAIDPDENTPIKAEIDANATAPAVTLEDDAPEKPPAPPSDLEQDAPPTPLVSAKPPTQKTEPLPPAKAEKPHARPFVNLNPNQALIDNARRQSNTRIIRLPTGQIIKEPIDKTKPYNH